MERNRSVLRNVRPGSTYIKGMEMFWKLYPFLHRRRFGHYYYALSGGEFKLVLSNPSDADLYFQVLSLDVKIIFFADHAALPFSEIAWCRSPPHKANFTHCLRSQASHVCCPYKHSISNSKNVNHEVRFTTTTTNDINSSCRMSRDSVENWKKNRR